MDFTYHLRSKGDYVRRQATQRRASGAPAKGFKKQEVSNSGVTEQCAILLAEAYAHRLQLIYGMWLMDRLAYFVYTPAGLQASAVGAVRV